MWHNKKRRKRLSSAAADQSAAAPAVAVAPRVTRHSVAATTLELGAPDTLAAEKAVLAAASSDRSLSRGGADVRPRSIPQQVMSERVACQAQPHPQVLDHSETCTRRCKALKPSDTELEVSTFLLLPRHVCSREMCEVFVVCWQDWSRSKPQGGRGIGPPVLLSAVPKQLRSGLHHSGTDAGHLDLTKLGR